MAMDAFGKLEPYGEFRELAPDLYCLDGEWEGTVFRRRMTIVRLKSGDLVIHSAIRLKDQDYSFINKLGGVAIIVAPNFFHCSDAHVYKMRFPKAKLLAPRGAAKVIVKNCKVDGLLPSGWPPEIKSEIECLEFKGTRMTTECVFFHRASRSLITTDLVFNMQDDVQGFEKTFFKLNKIYKRFGPSRIFRYGFVKNKREAAESFREILKWDFDRVIMSHGQVMQTGGKQAFQRGFEEIGIS